MTIVPLMIFLLSLTPLVQTTHLHALYPHGELIPEHLLFNIKTTGAAGEYDKKPLTTVTIFAPATANPTSTTTPVRPGRKYKRVVCPPGFTRAGDVIPGLDSSIPSVIHDVPGPVTNGPSIEPVIATNTGGSTTPNSQGVPSSAPSAIFNQFTVPGISSTPNVIPSGESVAADPSPSTPNVPVFPIPVSQSTPTLNPPAPSASPQAGAPSAASIPPSEHVTETKISGDPPSLSIPPASPPVSPVSPASFYPDPPKAPVSKIDPPPSDSLVPASPLTIIPSSVASSGNFKHKEPSTASSVPISTDPPVIVTPPSPTPNPPPSVSDQKPPPPSQVPSPSIPTPDGPSSVLVAPTSSPQVPSLSTPTPDGPSSLPDAPAPPPQVPPPPSVLAAAEPAPSVHVQPLFTQSASPAAIIPSSAPSVVFVDVLTILRLSSTPTPDAPSSLPVAPPPPPPPPPQVPAPPAQTPAGPSSVPVAPSPTAQGPALTQIPDAPSSVHIYAKPLPTITSPDSPIGTTPSDLPSSLQVVQGLEIPVSTADSLVPPSPPKFFVRQAITDPNACIPIPDNNPTGASALQQSAISQNLPTPITTQVTFTTSESGTLVTGVTIVTTFPGFQEIQPVPITTHVTLTTSISGTLQTVVMLVTTTPPPVPIDTPQATTTLITFTTSISGTLQTVVALVTTTPSLTNPTTETITYITLISGTPETKVTVLTEEAFVGFATATTTPFSAITILLDWPVSTTTSRSGFGGSFSTYRDGITFWEGIMCGFIIMGVWL